MTPTLSFKKRVLLVLSIVAVCLFIAGRIEVNAQSLLDPVCTGEVAEASVCQDNTAQDPKDNSLYGPDGILTKTAKIISVLVGIASVIVFIIGGMKYITSGGDASKVASAKNAVIAAVVGIIITVFASLIISFVLNKL